MGMSSGLTLRGVHGVACSEFFKKASLATVTLGTTHYAATRAGCCSECVPTLSHALLDASSGRHSGSPVL